MWNYWLNRSSVRTPRSKRRGGAERDAVRLATTPYLSRPAEGREGARALEPVGRAGADPDGSRPQRLSGALVRPRAATVWPQPADRDRQPEGVAVALPGGGGCDHTGCFRPEPDGASGRNRRRGGGDADLAYRLSAALVRPDHPSAGI